MLESRLVLLQALRAISIAGCEDASNGAGVGAGVTVVVLITVEVMVDVEEGMVVYSSSVRNRVVVEVAVLG